MNPLSTAREYLARQQLELQFKRVIGQASFRQVRDGENLHALPASDRDVVERAIAAGLVPQLKPGVVDRVLTTPELACALIEHGATPTNGFLRAMRALSAGRSWCMGWTAGDPKNAPASPGSWLLLAVDKAGSRHPQLDWFMPDIKKCEDSREVFAFKHRMHFSGLPGVVAEARLKAGIPLAPLHAGQDTLDALLDDALSPYDGVAGLDWNQQGQWIKGLLQQGADPNRRSQRTTYEPPLCVLARACRPNLQRGLIALENGARVDEQALLDVLYILHDTQHALRVNQGEAGAWFEKLLDQSGVMLTLDTIVPSSDYHQPTVETILERHCPEAMDAVRCRSQAVALERNTQQVAHSGLAKRRL